MRRLRFWVGLAAVAAIALGSVLGAIAIRADNRADFEHEQREAATRAAWQLESLAFLAVGQLKAAAASYQLQDRLGPHEFGVLAGSLLREGALSATAFVTAREECCRAVLVASARGGSPGLGADVDSHPAHAAALRSARDRGEPAITPIAPATIARGRGLVTYAPVYRDGAPTRTVAQRRAALVGFAAGAFRKTDLGLAIARVLPGHVEAQLRYGGEPVVGPAGDLADAASAPVQIADRTWLLVVRDPDAPGVGLPLLMAVLGISLAALLGALILVWGRKERMQELQRQASHDVLTGLKNRRRFDEDLRDELARSRRVGSRGALLILDLDHFKRVNDTLGHAIGDRVIGEIASVLRGRTRETDVLARLGGDEFAIVLPHCELEEAYGVASAIIAAIREHVPRSPDVPRITASVGVAMFGGSAGTHAEEVQHEADAAMYEAKEAGRDMARIAASHANGATPAGSP